MSKQSAYFRVPNLGGEHGSKTIKHNLDGIHGVISVSVNLTSNKVAVDFDSTGTNCEKLKEEIEKSGFETQLIAEQEHIM
jgi:copper chaperone CopZ